MNLAVYNFYNKNTINKLYLCEKYGNNYSPQVSWLLYNNPKTQSYAIILHLCTFKTPT
jgi:phosphatidylethanolamine-binding protein (PEBP) family uncharacterized protein